MELITAYATKNDCYKKAQKMTPRGIVVHSTGANNPYLCRYVDAPEQVGENRFNNHWNQPGISKCVHAFIGYASRGVLKVAQTLPYDYCCWGCGSGSKGSYNYNPAYIQFEMCEDDLSDQTYMEAVFQTAVEYCVYLCQTFRIPVENIVSHTEAHAQGYASNHGDPENWWGYYGRTMDDFRAAVRRRLSEENEASATVYQVLTGTFKDRAGAEALAEKLNAAGFDAYIVPETGGEAAFPETAPPLKTVDEIAHEVIRGLWGNGAGRKTRLTAAGYDYSAIQKRVNELMK